MIDKTFLLLMASTLALSACQHPFAGSWTVSMGYLIAGPGFYYDGKWYSWNTTSELQSDVIEEIESYGSNCGELDEALDVLSIYQDKVEAPQLAGSLQCISEGSSEMTTLIETEGFVWPEDALDASSESFAVCNGDLWGENLIQIEIDDPRNSSFEPVTLEIAVDGEGNWHDYNSCFWLGTSTHYQIMMVELTHTEMR